MQVTLEHSHETPPEWILPNPPFAVLLRSGTCAEGTQASAWGSAHRRSAPPEGYRELRSPAEMRRLLNRKIVQQDGKCAICRSAFTDYNEIVPYADFGIRHRMPTFRICRSGRHTGPKRGSAAERCRHIQSASRNARSVSGGR